MMTWHTREIDGEWFAVATDDNLRHAQATAAARGEKNGYEGRVAGPFATEREADLAGRRAEAEAAGDVVVYAEGGLLAVLTVNSPASSYGLPVLRVEGQDYGPGDRVPVLGRLAGEWVAEWAAQPERTAGEREAARRFIGK